jgi:predicted ribosomally synthesized peptide with SipW-like signal peptide
MGVLGIGGAVACLITLAAYASTTRSRSGRRSKPTVHVDPTPGTPRRSKSRKILLSLTALGLAGSMAGLGTFAAYTSTTSASNSVTTGVVAIALATSGTGNRMSVAATGVLPGDFVERVVDLTSTSTDALATVKLTTTAPTVTSALNIDGTNGLQLLIQKCTVAWTETANTAPVTGYSYTCTGGTATTVMGSASFAVIQTNALFGTLAATSGPGNITPTMDHLMITMTLPSATTEAQVPQSSASTILFTFNATQRSGPTSR